MTDTQQLPPTIYSNNVELRVSPYDFKMTFGEVVGLNGSSGLEVLAKCTVYMSPQHAKAFADMLVKNLAEYEVNVGKIPLPLAEDIQPVAKKKPAKK